MHTLAHTRIDARELSLTQARTHAHARAHTHLEDQEGVERWVGNVLPCRAVLGRNPACVRGKGGGSTRRGACFNEAWSVFQ